MPPRSIWPSCSRSASDDPATPADRLEIFSEWRPHAGISAGQRAGTVGAPWLSQDMAQPTPSHLDPTGPTGPVGPAGVHRARDLVTGLDEVLWAARTPE